MHARARSGANPKRPLAKLTPLTPRNACNLPKRYVYIYDKRGLEVHCLRDHTAPAALEFLPHHFLLASVGEAGLLTYQVGPPGEGAGVTDSKCGCFDRHLTGHEGVPACSL